MFFFYSPSTNLSGSSRQVSTCDALGCKNVIILLSNGGRPCWTIFLNALCSNNCVTKSSRAVMVPSTPPVSPSESSKASKSSVLIAVFEYSTESDCIKDQHCSKQLAQFFDTCFGKAITKWVRHLNVSR